MGGHKVRFEGETDKSWGGTECANGENWKYEGSLPVSGLRSEWWYLLGWENQGYTDWDRKRKTNQKFYFGSKMYLLNFPQIGFNKSSLKK